MGELAIRGGVVVDATGQRRADVVVRDGLIVEVEVGDGAGDGIRRVIDATGCFVAPGLVDLHAHLREPGFEDSETVETGARAAALGGYTAVVAMPNTDPPIDRVSVVDQVRRAGLASACDVFPAGCITKGRAGRELAPLGELYDAGVRIFTDDGSCVGDAALMRRALEYAHALPGAVVAQHCEEPALAAAGHMNEGIWSGRLGIPGVPCEAESVIVARDLALLRMTGGRLHLLHLSCPRSVSLVQEARREGLAVTAEVAPHHLILTDEACASFDPVFKVNPPLRTAADVEELRAALSTGAIDAIATDHAPHAAHHKDVPFDEASPGMIGLETALALVLTDLVASGVIDLRRALALLSWQPAAIAGIGRSHGGPVAPGRPANLCVVDPEAPWEVRPGAMASRSSNSPYAGRKLSGRVRHTLLRGELVVVDGEAVR
ncbi:MAG: dihydroorotase [Acidimicrobiia bacterium]